jgi:hypothetical protein
VVEVDVVWWFAVLDTWYVERPLPAIIIIIIIIIDVDVDVTAESIGSF